MKRILLYLWELPQNLVGLCLTLFYKCDELIPYKDRKIRYCSKFKGGISLGNYVFVGTKNNNTIKHEYGHTIQSKLLGPLYLFIVGIPSILWASIYGTKIIPYSKNGYYKFYTEKWANKLGEVDIYN